MGISRTRLYNFCQQCKKMAKQPRFEVSKYNYQNDQISRCVQLFIFHVNSSFSWGKNSYHYPGVHFYPRYQDINLEMSQNIAAWLPGVGKQLEIRPANKPVAKGGELLIQVIICIHYQDNFSILPTENKYLIPSRIIYFVNELLVTQSVWNKH